MRLKVHAMSAMGQKRRSQPVTYQARGI